MKHAWLVLLTILLTACGAATPVDTSPMPEVTAITPQPTRTTPSSPTAYPTTTPTPSPTIAPTFTPNPQVNTALPEEVIFTRAGSAEYFYLGINVVELWAAAPDGTDERLITTYAPAVHSESFSRSPDGRYIVVSDPPGANLINLHAGDKTPLIAIEPPTLRVQSFAWGPNSDVLYYVTFAMPGGNPRHDVTLYRQTIEPLDEPQALQEGLQVEFDSGNPNYTETPAYPDRVLPDGRLLLWVPVDHGLVTWGLYDPVTDALIPFRRVDRKLLIHDVRQGEVVYTERGIDVYTGEITPDGNLIEQQHLARYDRDVRWRYGWLRYLPDSRIVGTRLSVGPGGTPLAPSQIVTFAPDGDVTTIDVPGNLYVNGPVSAWNGRFFMPARDTTDANWLIPLDGGDPIERPY